MRASPIIPVADVVSFSGAAVASSRPVLERLESLERDRSAGKELTIPTLAAGEQYRFHFDMTRCIGCRCCEVACNEQNDNPAHVRWRRVGEIEGGSYPHVARLHLSMSCNHCLEPACLEGCPTDAYTKLANGIVDHDADACIGCQYCTWSCPYGVPQFHPERRIVTKCHLCAERLAEGDLPACVAACPTKAIEVESVNVEAWRRATASGDAPGVPPADLTLSTTRITIPEDLPESMGRSESWQLELEAPHWPLVVLLILSQASVGLFAAALAMAAIGGPAAQAGLATMAAALAVGSIAIAASAFHLGRPLHALRALRAWRRSWLSREAVALAACLALGGAATALELLGFSAWSMLLVGSTVVAGGAGVASSAGIYLLPARPAWNTWRTPAQFALTTLSLGAAGALVILGASGGAGGQPTALAWSLAGTTLGATLLQAFLPWTLIAGGLAAEESPWRGTALLLTQRSARLLWLKTAMGAAAGLLSLAGALRGPAAPWCFGAALASALIAEVIGRYLFFVTVVPRNMPGHFFSRNSPLHH